jgi:hypothetical protein
VRGQQAAAPELPEPLGDPPPRQEAEVAMPAANLESLENFGTRALGIQGASFATAQPWLRPLGTARRADRCKRNA